MSAESASHACVPPDDAQGKSWAGRRDADGAPLWACPSCGRWWGYAWPGFGGRVEEPTWLPMRDLFTGHDPATFQGLIDAERERDGR